MKKARSGILSVGAAFAAVAILLPLEAAANGRRHAGPPPVAIDACLDAAEGDECGFLGRRDEEIVGTCEVIGDVLACLPEGGRRPRRGECRERDDQGDQR